MKYLSLALYRLGYFMFRYINVCLIYVSNLDFIFLFSTCRRRMRSCQRVAFIVTDMYYTMSNRNSTV
jgi:hypothetical protein